MKLDLIHIFSLFKTQINLSRKTICVRLDGYLVFLTNFTVVVYFFLTILTYFGDNFGINDAISGTRAF